MDSTARIGRVKYLTAAVMLAYGGAVFAGGVPVITANVVRMADGRDQVNMMVVDKDAHGTPYGPSGFAVYIKAIGRNDPVNHRLSNYDGVNHTASDTTSQNPAYFLAADQLLYGYSCSGTYGNWSGCAKGSMSMFGPADDTYDVYVYATNGVGASNEVLVGTYNISASPKMQSVSGFPHLVNIANYPSDGKLAASFNFFGHDFEPASIALAQLVNENRGGTWGWYPGPWSIAVPPAGNNSALISWPVNRDASGSINFYNFVRKYELATAFGDASSYTWMLIPGKFADMPGVSNEILFDLKAPELRGNVFDPVTGKYAITGYDSTDGVSGRTEWGMASVGLDVKHKVLGTPTSLSTTSLSPIALGMKGILDLTHLPDGYYTADAVLVDKFGNATKQPIESNLEIANQVVTLKKNGTPFTAGSITGFSQLQMNLSEVADAASLTVTLTGGPENVSLPMSVSPSGQGFVIAQPLIVPSGATNDYMLVATIKTKNGVDRSYQFPLKYEPVTIGVDPALGVTAVLVPASATPVATKVGGSSFTTDSFGLNVSADVTVRWTGNMPIVVDGQAVAPGGKITYSGYDFGSKGGKFVASIATVKDGDVPSGKFLVMTNADGAPIMSASVIGINKPTITLSAASGMPASPFYVLKGSTQTAFVVTPGGNAAAGKLHVTVTNDQSSVVENSVQLVGANVAIKVNESAIYSQHAMSVDVAYDLFPTFGVQETGSYTVLGELPGLAANPLKGSSQGSIEATGKVGVKGTNPLAFDVNVHGRLRVGATIKNLYNQPVKYVDFGEANESDVLIDLGSFAANTYTVVLDAELLTSDGKLTGVKTYSSPVSLAVLPGVGLDSAITEGSANVPVSATAMHHASGMWPVTSAKMVDSDTKPITGVSDIEVQGNFTGGPITIAGKTLVSGGTVTISNYDFAANDSRITVPFSATSEALGRLKFIPAVTGIPAFEAKIAAIDITKALSLTGSAPTVSSRIQPFKTTLGATGSLCSRNVQLFKAGSVVGPQIGCAIRFDNIPDGLSLDSGNRAEPVSGIFAAPGASQVAYTLGWAESGVFTPLTGGKTIDVNVTVPTLPVLKFLATPGSEIAADSYIVRGGNGSLGTLVGHSDEVGAKVIVEVGPSAHHTTQTGQMVAPSDASVSISMSKPDTFSQESLSLKVYYADAPDLKVEKTIQVGVLGASPSIALDKSAPLANRGGVNIPLYYGFGNSPENYQFDPVAMGKHKLSFSLKNAAKVELASVPGIYVSGPKLNVPMGDLVAGTYYLTVRDQMVDENDAVIISNDTTIPVTVLDGRPVSSKITTYSAPVSKVPMGFYIELRLDEGFSTEVVGQTDWLVSYDGSSYAPPGVGPRSGPFSFEGKLATPGDIWIKAKVINRVSGAAFETNAIKLSGIKTPEMSAVIPMEALKGKPIKLSAVEKNGQAIEYVWIIGEGKKITTLNGPNVEYTPETIGRMSVRLVGKLPGTSNDDRVTASNTYYTVAVDGPRIKSVPIEMVGATRIPVVLQVGRTYTFRAGDPVMFGGVDPATVALESFWTMPDGRVVDGKEVVYTAKEKESGIKFTMRLKDSPLVKFDWNYRYNAMPYIWPSFTLATNQTDQNAPASITYMLDATTSAGRAFISQFQPKLTWNLPDGMKQVMLSRNMMFAVANTAGNYGVSVTVSDDQGNSTVVPATPVTVQPAVIAEFIASTAVSDTLKRAPTSVIVNAFMTKVGKNDSVDVFNVYLDGALAASGAKGPFKLNIGTAGNHTVKVEMKTKGGASASKDYSVDLIAAPTPACTIDVTGTRQTYMTFKANCSVPVGKIVDYRWYADGVLLPLRAAQFTLYSSQIAKGLPAEYRVVAVTDHGEEGDARYNP